MDHILRKKSQRLRFALGRNSSRLSKPFGAMSTFEATPTRLPTPTSFRRIEVVCRFFGILLRAASHTTKTVLFVPHRTRDAFTIRGFATLSRSIGYGVLNSNIEFIILVP